MAHYRSFRDLDWPLLLLALSISALGVLQIYSATHAAAWQDAWWKQLVYIAGGLILLWLLTAVDYHTLLGQVPVLYGTSVVLLIGVLLFGAKIMGGRRWIRLGGGFTFQVSEFVKVVIILLIARYLTELKSDHLETRDILKLGGLVAIPTLLVMKQPDKGTALTYLAVLGIGLLVGGLRWQHALLISVLSIGVVLVDYRYWMHDYQKTRWTSFLNPEADPIGAGYQVIQSQIAVGSGGIWGRGPMHGTQTQFGFLPVPHKDFIFATFGEEHGFVGVVAVLGLYFLLLMQIVQNAQTAPDRSGMYICMGVAGLLLFHLLVNVGMVVGKIPVIGIPLPLMSAGGSSMLAVFIMLGLVMNVRLRRFVN